MELDVALNQQILTFTNKPATNGRTLRFVYKVDADTLTYTFEMKQAADWQLLFTTVYHRKK